MSHLPFEPIPGTEPSPRGLFVDRWGTLLELPERGFCPRFEQAEFIPGAVDALFRARQAGWKIYLLGNEDAVAFGQMAKSTWNRFEQALLEHLRQHGAEVHRSYACTDHPDGKGEHQRPSVFLLPNTGAMYHAAQEDGIDLEQSWVIGDSTLELIAGARAGCHTAAVRTGLALSDGTLHVEPDLWAPDLAGVLTQFIGQSEPLRRAS